MAEDSLEGMDPATRDDLARLATELANDPKTRPVFLRLTQHKRPGTVIPELALEDRVASALKPVLEKVSKLEGERATQDAARNVADRRAEARDKLGLDKTEFEALETFMVEQHKSGNAFTHETAHEFLQMRQKTAEPTAPSYRFAAPQLPNKDEMKKHGGFRGFFRSEAHKAVDDIRAGRVKVH